MKINPSGFFTNRAKRAPWRGAFTARRGMAMRDGGTSSPLGSA